MPAKAEMRDDNRLAAERIGQREQAGMHNIMAARIEPSEIILVRRQLAQREQPRSPSGRERARRRPGTRRDALAAAKAEIDREQMPKNAAQCRPRRERVEAPEHLRFARQHSRDQNWPGPFMKSNANTSSSNLRLSTRPTFVARCQFATARLEDVHATSACDQPPERDGPDQVGREQGQDGKDHVLTGDNFSKTRAPIVFLERPAMAGTAAASFLMAAWGIA